MSRAAFARSPRRLRATFPLALALCAAAACADSGGASAPDTAPPHVLATNPVDGAQGISATSAVSVSFSEDVAPASVTATSFVVIPQGGAAALSGTYVVTGSEVTFQPAESLAAGTTYVVRLTGEITDLAGNALGSVTEFSFATRTNGAPVASAGAAQDASWNAVVTLDGTSSTDPDGDPIAYEWTQTGGPAVTLADENTATPTFTAPSKVTTLTFTLRVTDSQNEIGVSSVVVRVWVDKTKAVFVSATTGDDGSAGSLEAPVKTIGRGISLASGRGPGAAVYVAGGTYTESLALTTGLGIYGGFSASSWTRLGSQTILAGGPTAVSMSSASGAILEGLDIRSASPTTGGASSVGVFVSNSTDVVIAGCTIGAANGAAGAAGAAGQAGAHGSIGSAGQPGNCSNQGGAAYAGEGGSGGALVWGGGGGGRGGYQVVCNDFGLNCIWSTAMGVSGWSAQGSGTGGGGGAGGAPGSDSGVSGQSGGAGQDGGNGTLGSPGPDYGWIGVTGYVAATVGGVGAFGKGGGGGGGGGGSFGRREGFLFTPGLAGNGGGGGGGGGEGGHGGLGGRGGGGSFGVLAYGSTVTVTGSSITTGNGGPGGGGGQGGGGGSGGNGGTGNTFCQLDIGSGGSGGRGGRGGAGGQGGGGSGGPSIGIAWDPSSTVTQTGSTIQAGSGGTPGAPNGLAGITAGTLQR